MPCIPVTLCRDLRMQDVQGFYVEIPAYDYDDVMGALRTDADGTLIP